MGSNDLCVGGRGKRGHQIDLREERVACAGRNGAEAADDKRDEGSRLERAVFRAAQRFPWSVFAEQFGSIVLVAIVEQGTVVAAEDNRRSFCQFE